jgi:hypothetical protein
MAARMRTRSTAAADKPPDVSMVSRFSSPYSRGTRGLSFVITLRLRTRSREWYRASSFNCAERSERPERMRVICKGLVMREAIASVMDLLGSVPRFFLTICPAKK